MHFHQFYLRCLAHASYLIGDAGECVIVDPQRDVDGYLAAAEERGLRITHVIETHLHADFVSGHLELAKRTGATLHISHAADAAFAHGPLHEGDEIRVGTVRLRVLETPGHTPESLCLLVSDDAAPDAPAKLLTGDTLFIGDVGRPDLAGGRGFTAEQMAGLMYDSLRDKILTLPDETEVFPAHGAGSACGRNISAALSCTIGRQRETNHALQPMSREDFVQRMTTGLAPPPPYFPHSVALNRAGAVPLDELPQACPLYPDEVAPLLEQGALLLDLRHADAHAQGHPPGALNIGLNGSFAPWAGSLIPTDTRLILLGDDDAQCKEAVMRLARVGLQHVDGMLAGGVDAWVAAGRPLATRERVSVQELHARLQRDDAPRVLDVRNPGEHENGHVPGAINIPLGQLAERSGELDPGAHYAVICQGGYRSSSACCLLERAGLHALTDIREGTGGWVEAELPVETPVA
ncbi:MAG: MBL fold hydrolase [Planctomycetota bacterium]|nr:MAG: MBL fold hydrolase [Planctomycetota bacterium]